MKSHINIGLSACFFHKDPKRAVFKNQELLYVLEPVNQLVIDAGALPWLLPRSDLKTMKTQFSQMDALLLQGGSDVAPENYGETRQKPEWAGDMERDIYEKQLISWALEMNKPILGICRGLQILNVYFGGSLHQDLSNASLHRNWDIYEDNHHSLSFVDGGLLHKTYEKSKTFVNSVHHQGIKQLAKGLVIEATSDIEGLPEAFRLEQKSSSDPWCLAVQWHPEISSSKIPQELDPKPLMKLFMDEVQKKKIMKIINPATEEILKELSEDNADSVHQKFLKVSNYQKTWAAVPYEQKRKAIEKFCVALEAEHKSLAKTLSSEMGKPLSQAEGEILGVRKRIQFFMERAEKCLQADNVFADPDQKLNEMISFEPLGVVANISAWNYPYFVSCNVLIPALLTGNVVLFKPSEHATLSGQAMVDLLWKSGIPQEALQIVIGAGQVGQAILEQNINGIFFTGSHPTGKKIAQAVAGRMIKVQLELGGKDPVYVADDVDLKTVVPDVVSGVMYNTGQSCCSVERLYVHEKIYDSFVHAFIQESKTLDIGPLARKEQVQVLQDQVEDALKKGAKLALGGKTKTGKGYFFEPTVLLDVNHSMKLMSEESFGPIIGIQKVSGDEEALKLMNDTQYGLTAAVYTPNADRAKTLLRQLHAGTVYWNCCDRVSPYLPWTGRKHSGIGSTLSEIGIETFLQPKAWHMKG